MKEKLKLESGITLIALVITIIVLLVLSAVSISILGGENGLINKAVQSKEKQEYSNYSDRLQLVVQNTFINTQSDDIDVYLADIKKDEILKDAKIDKEDDTTAYITMDNKYVYTLQVDRNGQISFDYNGMVGKLKPKVVSISIANITTNSITINTTAIRTDKYKYYIKNVTTGEFDYKGENNTGTFEYKDLTQGITQEIKVVAINENGEDYKTITEVTGSLPTGTITIGNLQWHSNSHKATVTISSTVSNYQLQYSTDRTNWISITSGQETEEQENNTTIYARLYDGINQSNEEYVQYTIADNDAPTAPTLTIAGIPSTDVTGWYTENVTLNVTDGYDADSGVDRTTYILSGATEQAETEIGNNGTIIISNNGTTTITAYTYDGAGYKSEAGTKTINKDEGTALYDNVNSKTQASHTHTEQTGACYQSATTKCNGTMDVQITDSLWGKDREPAYYVCRSCGKTETRTVGEYRNTYGYTKTCPYNKTTYTLICGKTPVTATVSLQKATNMQRERYKVVISNGTIDSITWSGDYTNISDTEVIVNSGAITCNVNYTAGTSDTTGTTTATANF